MSEPIALKEEPKPPLHVLRAKQGSHMYLVLEERKKGQEWLIQRADDPNMSSWLPKERALAIADKAWEWDDELMNACLELKRQCVIHGISDALAYTGADQLIELMRETRLKAKGEQDGD